MQFFKNKNDYVTLNVHKKNDFFVRKCPEIIV